MSKEKPHCDPPKLWPWLDPFKNTTDPRDTGPDDETYPRYICQNCLNKRLAQDVTIIFVQGSFAATLLCNDCYFTKRNKPPIKVLLSGPNTIWKYTTTGNALVASISNPTVAGYHIVEIEELFRDLANQKIEPTRISFGTSFYRVFGEMRLTLFPEARPAIGLPVKLGNRYTGKLVEIYTGVELYDPYGVRIEIKLDY